MTGPTPFDRAASAPLAVLGVVLLVRTHGGTSPVPLDLLAAVLGTLAVVAAARVWCRRCFESHLLGAMVAVTSTAGQLLVVVVGPPGGSGAAWTADRLTVAFSGVLALVLLTSAGRSRTRPVTTRTRPYAR